MLSLSQTVRASEDTMTDRYYSLAMATLFMYDYFLTLSDEIKYVWKEGRTWMSYVFIINRYVPFVFQTWGIVAEAAITAEVFHTRSLCREFTIIKALSFVISTLVAQIIIGIRAYALSGFNRKLLVVLLSLGTTYLVLAVGLICTIIFTPRPPPTEPFGTLRVCLRSLGQVLGFACLVAVLAFDTVAIASIIFSVIKIRREVSGFSNIPGTMLRDVMIYFLVIFVSHLGLIVTVSTARPELKIIPAIGLEAMIPVMVTRLTLTLKKVIATDPDEDEDTSAGSFTARPSSPRTVGSDSFLYFIDVEPTRVRVGLPFNAGHRSGQESV